MSHIDQTLSWNVHVEILCKKIASGIGAFKRVRTFVPLETLRSMRVDVMLYKSLNGLTPDYLSSKVVDRSSVSNGLQLLLKGHRGQTSYPTATHKLYEE